MGGVCIAFSPRGKGSRPIAMGPRQQSIVDLEDVGATGWGSRLYFGGPGRRIRREIFRNTMQRSQDQLSIIVSGSVPRRERRLHSPSWLRMAVEFSEPVMGSNA